MHSTKRHQTAQATRPKTEHTKPGVASFYVVIFATILFAIITLSFIHVVLSESRQSLDDDLSRSAYDAALAGVEDAKRAVTTYFACQNNSSAPGCDLYLSQLFLNDSDCSDGYPLKSLLYPSLTGNEVALQSTTSADGTTTIDEAYTCVLLTTSVPDYRATLTTDTRTRVVPIRIGITTPNISTIKLSWYSNLNQGSSNTLQTSDTLRSKNPTPIVPPVLQATLIATQGDILSNSVSPNNTSTSFTSTVILLPSNTGADNDIPQAELESAGSAVSSDFATDMNNPNHKFPISCETSSDFACSVNLDVAGVLTNKDNVYLALSLPYGDAYTDFAVQLLDSSNQPIDFQGVQISVDSTGRANQLVRRIEARLDPADLYFPYPSYALEASGDITKNFSVTANCWYTTSNSDGTLASSTCNNKQDL